MLMALWLKYKRTVLSTKGVVLGTFFIKKTRNWSSKLDNEDVGIHMDVGDTQNFLLMTMNWLTGIWVR